MFLCSYFTFLNTSLTKPEDVSPTDKILVEKLNINIKFAKNVDDALKHSLNQFMIKTMNYINPFEEKLSYKEFKLNLKVYTEILYKEHFSTYQHKTPFFECIEEFFHAYSLHRNNFKSIHSALQKYLINTPDAYLQWKEFTIIVEQLKRLGQLFELNTTDHDSCVELTIILINARLLIKTVLINMYNKRYIKSKNRHKKPITTNHLVCRQYKKEIIQVECILLNLFTLFKLQMVNNCTEYTQFLHEYSAHEETMFLILCKFTNQLLFTEMHGNVFYINENIQNLFVNIITGN